jgi:hypothetical protein
MLRPVLENLERADRDPARAVAHLLMARAALTDAINEREASREAATADRGHIRATLPARLDQLRNTLSLAVGALDGPDPEAAFGYLAVLDEHLQEALGAPRSAG